MLLLLISFPIIGALIIPCVNKLQTIKWIGMSTSLLTFSLSMYMWQHFDSTLSSFQWSTYLPIIYPIHLGIDGISLSLILLTTCLTPVCLLIGWKSIQSYIPLYNILFLLMESFLIGLFSVLDLIAFYILFESVLIPMFLIIGIWGSRDRKIHAAYQFFLYTLVGSLFMLIGIIYLVTTYHTSDIESLLSLSLSRSEQRGLWLLFFMSFAIKIPMVPFHIWLPEAHVEAPTAGSVMLAGVLLKLGAYGFLRLSLPLFPEASTYYTPFIYLLSTLGILYVSLTTLRQIDLKKIIAYSSIAHMGYVTYGLFTNHLESLVGSTLTLISHGFISSSLFILVGTLYDRYKTRILLYYKGLTTPMPLFSTFKFLFILANMSLPLMSSFVGELLILLGLFQTNGLASLLACIGLILSAAYIIWYYNRLAFGALTPSITHFNDLVLREVSMLLPLVILVIWIGISPNCLIEYLTPPLTHLISTI